jgi:hypothetical protein
MNAGKPMDATVGVYSIARSSRATTASWVLNRFRGVMAGLVPAGALSAGVWEAAPHANQLCGSSEAGLALPASS